MHNIINSTKRANNERPSALVIDQHCTYRANLLAGAIVGAFLERRGSNRDTPTRPHPTMTFLIHVDWALVRQPGRMKSAFSEVSLDDLRTLDARFDQ